MNVDGDFVRPRFRRHRPPELDGATGRRPVVVVGAGPVGLVCALELARRNVPVVLVDDDDDDTVSVGSRAICWSRRSLEILDRHGIAERMLERGVAWQTGRVFLGRRELYRFDLPSKPDDRPASVINRPQYEVEADLVAAAEADPLIELRWRSSVSGVAPDHTGPRPQAARRRARPSGAPSRGAGPAVPARRLTGPEPLLHP